MESKAPHPCPICQSPTTRLFQTKGYWLRLCGNCRHRHAELAASVNHVQQVYADSYFTGGGAGYSDYLSEHELLRDRGAKYGRLLSRFLPPGTVFDVGAAAGFILQGLQSQGWEGAGLEPNPRMAAYAREQLKLDVSNSVLENFKSDKTFDVVTLIQVIAHFINPVEALEAAERLTKPNGYWLIETWNVESLTARLFRQHWHEYSPPSVLHWFCPQSLDTLTGKFGFTRIGQGRPGKWLNGAHAKSILKHAGAGSAVGRLIAGAASIVPDRLPIPYPAEDIFWSLYRRNG